MQNTSWTQVGDIIRIKSIWLEEVRVTAYVLVFVLVEKIQAKWPFINVVV